MAKRPKKTQKSQAKLQEFVVAAFAEDLEQARNYEVLLKDNNIPAIIKPEDEEPVGESLTGDKALAVMVPEDFLDEAHVIIESQNAYDDFYDLALDEENDDDFDSDLFEDDF